jgi:hypothetical protein
MLSSPRDLKKRGRRGDELLNETLFTSLAQHASSSRTGVATTTPRETAHDFNDAVLVRLAHI